MSRRRASSGRAPAPIHATFVPRHRWPSRGSLFLWGPDRPTRFPWVTALTRLGLPIAEDAVLETTSARLALPREGRFRIVTTHGVALSPLDALQLLGPVRFVEDESATRTRRRYRPTGSLTAWSLATKLALELVARQSFVPTVARGGGGSVHAVWNAVVDASHDIGRVRRLATDMPACGHALLQPASRRWRDRKGRGRRRRRAPRVWNPEVLVRAFLDASVDALVRDSMSDDEIAQALAFETARLTQIPVGPSDYDRKRAEERAADAAALEAAIAAAEAEEKAQSGEIEALSRDDADSEIEPADDDGADEEDESEESEEESEDESEGDDDGDDDGEEESEAEEQSGKRSRRRRRRRREPGPRARRKNGLALSELTIEELGPWELRWMRALLGPTEESRLEYHHDDPDLPKEFGNWLGRVGGTEGEAPKAVDSRTGLWLEMPEDALLDEPYWYLRYMLVALEDPTLTVAAQQVFAVGTSRLRVLDHSFDNPQEKMLTDLGYASTLFEPIKNSLEQPRPEGVYLDAREAWRFISEAGPVLFAAGFDVRLPEELTGQGQRRLRARLRIKDATASDREFDDVSHVGISELAAFQWEAALGDEVISAEEFKQIAELKQPLVQWRGTWVLVDPIQLRDIGDLLELTNAVGTMTRAEALSRALTGVADPSRPSSDIEIIVEGRIAELVEQMGNDELREEEVAVPKEFIGELRPYQERGLAWLVYQSRLGLGCCLADDMGLGKTIQLIAELLHHAEENPEDERGTLLVCPTSVVGNWQRELGRFAPSLHVIRHHGSDRASDIRELNKRMWRPNTVVITTYGLARRDVAVLKRRKWARFVLDEAQAIKNVAAKRSQAVREIDAEFRVALTGTPIENRLSELWSILDFLNPGLLGTNEKFRRAYAIPIERYQDPGALERLRGLVSPFLMRRVKTDPNIIQDLPEKHEMKVYCTLTREQATLYQALVDAAMAEIEGSEGITRHGRVLALLTRLKQVVDHPNLYIKDDDSSAKRSGKLTRMMEMLDTVADTGDRALIFTQFKTMGDVLVARIQERFDCEVPFLHGGVALSAREDLVDRFQDPEGPPFFVLSLKAGGTGLNLTAANHVFHYDRWWNPAVEDQATDRAFRIGQTRNVQVHKMISLGTLEEKIDVMLTEKRNLADTIVDSTGAWVTDLNADALRELVSLSSDAALDDVD